VAEVLVRRSRLPRWLAWLLAAGPVLYALLAAGAAWHWLPSALAHLTAYGALGAAGLALFLGWDRQRAPAGLAVAGLLLLVLPSWYDAALTPRLPPAHADDLPLRVATANVAAGNQQEQREAVLAALTAVDADLYVLTECPQDWAEELARRMRGRVAIAHEQPWAGGSGAIVTRLGLRGAQVLAMPPAGQSLLRAELDFHGQTLVVFGAHPSPGLGSAGWTHWCQHFGRMGGILATEPVAHALIGGDFNLARSHPLWRGFLTQAGLRVPPGGAPATWPSSWGPAGLAIDHLLCRGPWRATAAQAFALPGSDHRGLVAHVVPVF
jgi:endonuclease/exonuclease/phosphatase (EEP) superfamily protein YafD